jgi:hypothetical protein
MVAQVWSKILVSAASTALMTLGINTAAASAITIHFEGDRIKGSYTIGDDLYNSWFSQLSNPQYDRNGQSDLTLSRLGAITDFKLFVDGKEQDYSSNLNISDLFATSIDDAITPEHDYYYWEVKARKGLDGQRPSEEDYRRDGLQGRWQTFALTVESVMGGKIQDCLGMGKVCSGTVSILDPLLHSNASLKSNSSLTETIKLYVGTNPPSDPSNPNPSAPVKSVPEPTSVIGFLLLGGAFALKNKKKFLPMTNGAETV